MKRSLVLPILLFCAFVSAQDMNQFDAYGKRHGIWKKYFDDTTVLRYEGEFIHGKEIGLFKYYKNIDKKASLTATKQFNLEDNKTYVTFFTSTGKVISEGNMDGKLYVGVWKYYQQRNKGLLILENYDAQGRLDGDKFVYYENGQVAEKQFYKHGTLEGTSYWYSENNIVLKEFNYVNGVLDGVAKFFDPKGGLMIAGQYKNGVKYGVWKYYEKGELTGEKDFSYKPKKK